MKKIIIALLLPGAFYMSACAQSATAVKAKMASIFNPAHSQPLVCAHRGDWRNAPENSIQALKNCISMGVDIMEIDLKKTKDGHLIVMHDKTIDRTVKGKGKPEDLNLADIKKMWLRNGTGHATNHRVPTFEELMREAKDKIIIDIDKGYTYFDDVVAVLRKTGTMDQVILNITKDLPFDSVKAAHPDMPAGLVLMPVIDLANADAAAIANSYKPYKKIVFQFDFNNDKLPLLRQVGSLRKQGFGIWFNSIWPETSGGHHDDRAVEENQPDESWGWMKKMNTSIIQTDRPEALLNYFKRRT
ncbi:glycerophosphodiester phosphodiesterase family protein [Pedobacter sp. SYP-B3415]|uniref:glycerophosphodiester phosphodiesterase family protein n=1 Tax=Pedobacter sp. SYP-B3415 TaxID=2496641 RepID=UPI00101CAB2D|nr:glycerophosphodiester phosphodiesterase family protein [Pedobacter sp. SYP-B3415]